MLYYIVSYICTIQWFTVLKVILIYSYYKILTIFQCCTIYPCSLFYSYKFVALTSLLLYCLSLLPSPHWKLLVSSLHLWVFFFFVIFTGLLNSLDFTYKQYHTVFVFISCISLNIMPSKSTHVAANGKILPFLWLSNIPLHIPHLLFTFICWWTSRFLSYLGNYT